MIFSHLWRAVPRKAGNFTTSRKRANARSSRQVWHYPKVREHFPPTTFALAPAPDDDGLAGSSCLGLEPPLLCSGTGGRSFSQRPMVPVQFLAAFDRVLF